MLFRFEKSKHFTLFVFYGWSADIKWLLRSRRYTYSTVPTYLPTVYYVFLVYVYLLTSISKSCTCDMNQLWFFHRHHPHWLFTFRSFRAVELRSTTHCRRRLRYSSDSPPAALAYIIVIKIFFWPEMLLLLLFFYWRRKVLSELRRISVVKMRLLPKVGNGISFIECPSNKSIHLSTTVSYGSRTLHHIRSRI